MKSTLRWHVVTGLLLAVAAGCGSGGGGNNNDGNGNGGGSTSSGGASSNDSGSSGGGSSSAPVSGSGGSSSGASGSGSSSGGGSSSSPGVPHDPCTMGTIINLNTAGTVAGGTLTYTGSNATVPRGTGEEPACLSSGSAIHVQAHTYTTQAAGRLLVSTFHEGGVSGADTVVWARSECSATAATLGCNDDTEADRDRGVEDFPNREDLLSLFTTGTGADPATDGIVAAGTTVTIFVGTYAGSMPVTGAYILTVTELPAVPVTGSPCDPQVEETCAETDTCNARGTDYSDFGCATRGTLNGDCRLSSPECDSGLGCNLNDVCVAAQAAGATCDPERVESVCVSGTDCVGDTPVCVARGVEGGRCRTSGMRCDANLGCGADGLCVPQVAVGMTCDLDRETNVCVDGAACVGDATGMCILDGTLGGECRGFAAETRCDAGLRCSVNMCITAVLVGQMCNATADDCEEGSTCIGMEGSAVCVANGSLGAPCRDSGAQCDPTLVCLGDSDVMCAARQSMAGACDPAGVSTAVCPEGHVCEGTAAPMCTPRSYAAASSATAFVSVCGTPGATELMADTDDDTEVLPLPFAFTFYGAPHAETDELTVSSNGWLSFTATEGSGVTPYVLPAHQPTNAVFPLWMDLTFRDRATAEVCAATTGTAPNRQLVVEWKDANFYLVDGPNPEHGVNVQVRLHEGSGNIEFLYDNLRGTTPFNRATIGVQSALGSSFTQVCGGRTNGCSALENRMLSPTP